MRKLAIVVIVKNEGRYLIEWLAFHRAIGVRDFVIYDNESEDDTRAILNAHARLGVVAVNWPRQKNLSPQYTAYNHYLATRGRHFPFAAFIDADEFLVPPPGRTIGAWLDRIPPHAGAIAVNQRVFGSSGETDFRPDLVMRRFPRCSAGEAYPENRYVKPIYRRGAVATIHNCHITDLVQGERLMSDFSPAIPNPKEPLSLLDIRYDGLQLSHYIVKSLGEYRGKQGRGSPESHNEAFRFTRHTDVYFHGRESSTNVATCPRTESWIGPALDEMRQFLAFAEGEAPPVAARLRALYADAPELAEPVAPRAHALWRLRHLHRRRLEAVGRGLRRRLPHRSGRPW